LTPLPPGPRPEARVAGPGDQGRLVELWTEAERELVVMRGGRVLLGLNGRSAPVALSFASQLGDPAQRLVVGVLATQVVGYGSCRTRTLAGSDLLGSIEDLYVVPEARRQGVGGAIAGALLEWCHAEGCTGVDANALPGSRAVKSFFEANGFTARLLVMHRPLS